MIAVIDYGVGNLFSLQCSLAAIGAESVITGDAEVIQKADKLILPGVGAFGDAAAALEKSGLVPVIQEEVKKGKEVLATGTTEQMKAETDRIAQASAPIFQKLYQQASQAQGQTDEGVKYDVSEDK